MSAARNVLHLGVKELRGLVRDPILMVFVLLAFTVMIHVAATSAPQNLNKAPIAVVDEDRSSLSLRLADAFYPPHFLPAARIGVDEADRGMDAGRYTFILGIPSGFERDVLAGRSPVLRLDVDATRMAQAFSGSGHVQAVVAGEVAAFVDRYRHAPASPVELVLRARFNPELNTSWFTAVMELISQITLLSIVLTGAALLREREHGTVEHLLAMPVTPMEIMAAKVWSMALAVLLAASLSIVLVVRGALAVPIQGSVMLFLAGAAVHLFATTSMGIFLATFARSMPQFGLILMLVMMPLQILSGAMTPRESMPEMLQWLMMGAPNSHFVMLAQSILYRGAGIDLVWPQFAALALIGLALFLVALARFRRSLAAMA